MTIRLPPLFYLKQLSILKINDFDQLRLVLVCYMKKNEKIFLNLIFHLYNIASEITQLTRLVNDLFIHPFCQIQFSLI